MTKNINETPGAEVRGLIRRTDRAVLSTVQRDSGGWPHGSLVLVACDHDAAPLLLISDLADHTKNIKADDRISLLYDGTAGLDDPLTGSRATVMGRAAPVTDFRMKARFLARHPGAELYAGFADFNLYRVTIARAHVIAGFGRIHWVDGDAVSGPSGLTLEDAESGIVDHMNADHGDAVQIYAAKLLGLPGEGWRMTGCDQEGCDLRLGGKTARLGFDEPISDANEARAELVRLLERARG